LTLVRPLRGLYPIIDTAACLGAGVKPLELARAVAAAGVPAAQFRHKGPFTREELFLADQIGRLFRPARLRYIINDRADVALMVGAAGVHLGQDDLTPVAVRRMVGSSLWLGFSTHTAAQLRSAEQEPVDYLAIGPVFATGSKQNADPVLGVEALAELRRLTTKPLVAIGGITRDNAAAVLASGVDAVAVISDLLGPNLDQRLEQWLQLTQP